MTHGLKVTFDTCDPANIALCQRAMGMKGAYISYKNKNVQVTDMVYRRELGTVWATVTVREVLTNGDLS